MSLIRLQRELKQIKNEPIPGCFANLIDENDVYHWEAYIYGPEDSPYEGGKFKLTFKFPSNYPFSPPQVQFETRVYHPNINDSGHICLDILQDQWTPALTVGKILLSIIRGQ